MDSFAKFVGIGIGFSVPLLAVVLWFKAESAKYSESVNLTRSEHQHIIEVCSGGHTHAD